MAPNQRELVEAANAQRNMLGANKAATVAAIAAAIKIGSGTPIPGVHPSEINFDDPSDDPFSGNINNRNVAKRIAGVKTRTFIAGALNIPNGDPNKARADIARSEKLNPEPSAPVNDDDEKPKLPAPTAGSPAAARKAAEAAAAAAEEGKQPTPAAPVVPSIAPPTWKPNA